MFAFIFKISLQVRKSASPQVCKSKEKWCCQAPSPDSQRQTVVSTLCGRHYFHASLCAERRMWIFFAFIGFYQFLSAFICGSDIFFSGSRIPTSY